VPHDIVDLYLAPVALQIEARLCELAELDRDRLALKIATESDEPDWSPEVRTVGVLRTIGHLTDLHGWSLSWDARGVRVSHGKHALVLGVPANVRRYVVGDANRDGVS
jgi:hypothetical protein